MFKLELDPVENHDPLDHPEDLEHRDVFNFGAGPSQLPAGVREKVCAGIMGYHNTGISIMELSHRSPEFKALLDSCQEKLRKLLRVPPEYHILFLQGGATGQFAAIPLNLLGGDKASYDEKGRSNLTADYLVTGAWSAKSIIEADHFGQVREVCKREDTFRGIPNYSKMEFDENAVYFYYCDNETIHGVEFPHEIDNSEVVKTVIPKLPPDVICVCDMSSNMLTRPVDIRRFGVIIAGAQKNIGLAGLTLVIVRNDLLGRAMPTCPTILNFTKMAKENSLVNTPPVFNIFVTDIMADWLLSHGGLGVMHKRCSSKAKLIYAAIENSNGFYVAPVETGTRSRVTVVMRLADPNLENLFIKKAAESRIIGVKGHRSVGGLRFSLYNSIKLSQVRLLLEFMHAFRVAHDPTAVEEPGSILSDAQFFRLTENENSSTSLLGYASANGESSNSLRSNYSDDWLLGTGFYGRMRKVSLIQDNGEEKKEPGVLQMANGLMTNGTGVEVITSTGQLPNGEGNTVKPNFDKD